MYGCVAKAGIKQVKGTGSFYCEKHYPKENNDASAGSSPIHTGKH
jgi:hypothetical protein